MSGRQVPIVIVPRFTTFVNNTPPYITLPLDVRAYSGANLVAWRGTLNGTSPVFDIHFYESMDREDWTQCTGDEGGEIAATTETLFSINFTKKWFNVAINCTGTNASVTCWTQGFLIRREK